MAKRKFTPITTELEKLTPEQQSDYVLAVCEFLDVPAELGLVGLRWMDNEGGRRNLVLYVEKGATDIIRDKRGIDVDTMDETNGPGYVGWKVRGHDAKGRHEIAVGTVTTEGKKGKAAADAVMVAQTKACRRMTLQFAGGGFLDSSELDNTTTDLMNSAMSLKQLSEQPTVAPNAAPGQDITQTVPTFEPLPTKLKVGDKIVFPNNEVATVLSVSEPACTEPAAAGNGKQSEQPAIPPTAAPIAESPVEKIRKPRSRKKPIQLDSISVAQPAIAPEGDTPKTSPATEQKPGEAMTVAPVKPENPASVILDAQKTPEEIIANAKPDPAKAAPPIVPQPADGGVAPTPEQETEYRKKLSRYVNDILPTEGGFQQSEGMTRYDKIGKFFKKMFPKANTKSLSVAQWDAFFKFMDETHAAQGATALVNAIESQIKGGTSA